MRLDVWLLERGKKKLVVDAYFDFKEDRQSVSNISTIVDQVSSKFVKVSFFWRSWSHATHLWQMCVYLGGLSVTLFEGGNQIESKGRICSRERWSDQGYWVTCVWEFELTAVIESVSLLMETCVKYKKRRSRRC